MGPTSLAADEALPAEDPQSVALKLWVVLARAHRAIEAHAAADAARHGLTIAEFGVLELLYHKGDMLLGEIQRRILVSSGGITFLIDRLEAKGLVERRRCAHDRRARYAGLTPKGERFVRDVFPDHAARIQLALSALTPAEQLALTRQLRVLGKRAAELLAESEAASGVPRRGRRRAPEIPGSSP